MFILFLAVSVAASELGGHEPSVAEAPASVRAEDKALVLEEMWQRRILNPDQTYWAPADAALLSAIRESENDAIPYLKSHFGPLRRWTAVARKGEVLPKPVLTKEGYEKYRFELTRDALEYFEKKGADAKWALKMTDWDGKRLFDAEGKLTPAGVRVYTRARLKLEVYWKSPNGETFGTRRPPAASTNKQP